MTAKPKHTPEPWTPAAARHIHSGEGKGKLDLGEFYGRVTGPINRDRAVTCVNACAGINPEAIPGLIPVIEAVIVEMERMEVQEAVDRGEGPDLDEWEDSRVLTNLKAALKAMKGGTE